MTFTHWLHHLFNPHCEICKQEEMLKYEHETDELAEARVFNAEESEKERAHLLQMKIESNRCYSCEVLERQLSEANGIIKSLLEPKTTEEVKVDTSNFKPISAGRRWSVIQKELQDKDRELARVLKDQRVKEITPDNIAQELAEIQINAE